MSLAKRFAVLLAAAGLIAASASGVAAQSRIGNAQVARNTVDQIASSGTSPIRIGDDVFANERVRTGQDSDAKLVFSDSTNLAIGPSSTVTLDRFVYKGDTTYTKAAVNFAAGAFRFTTGGSDKNAYELKTATATIGVRGTQFDIAIRNGQTKLTLLEGEVAMCPRSRFDGDPGRLSSAKLKELGCLDMTRPGQTAQVTQRRAAFGGAPVNFASNCGGSAGLCSTTLASASQGSAGAAQRRTADGGVTPASLDPSDPALCYVNQD